MAFKILLTLTITFVVAFSNSSEFEMLRELSEKIFTAQKGQDYMTNLFLKHNEVIIKSRIYFTKNRKQTNLAIFETELILQPDYWRMYRKKLSPMLRFNLTQQVIQSIKSNFTFLQTTIYAVIRQSKHQIDKQTLPLMGNFSLLEKQGIDNWMMADEELLSKMPDQQMILTHQDIYFFQFDWQLPFPTKTQNKIQTFGLYKDSDKSYYYPKPLSKSINQQLKQNYIPLYNLKQGQVFSLKVDIKLAGYLYPLFIFIKERSQQIPDYSFYKIEELDQQLLNYRMVVVLPYLYRLIKKVVLQGSLINWVLFIWPCIALMLSSSVAVLTVLFQYWIFKSAKQNRGMSFYSLILSFALNLFILIGGYIVGSEDNSYILVLVSLLFILWKISRMGKIGLTFSFPFIKIQSQDWYQSYEENDWEILRMILPLILSFLSLVSVYPLVFQDYFEQYDQSGISVSDTINYIIKRLIGGITQYMYVFSLLIQVLLNLSLKSCNSMSWKLIVSLMVYFSVDNYMVLFSSNLSDVVYCFKQEIVIIFMIVQKIVYGNSLENMKIPLEHIDRVDQQNQPVNKLNDETQLTAKLQINQANRQQTPQSNQQQQGQKHNSQQSNPNDIQPRQQQQHIDSNENSSNSHQNPQPKFKQD